MSKIVFFGDSVTLGVRYGVTSADTFAHKIGAARGFSTIVNKGLSNDTSTTALARLATDVLSESPKCCVIMLGQNDVYYAVQNSTPAATMVANYVSNMDDIIDALQVAGIEVVVLSPFLPRTSPEIILFPDILIPALKQLCADKGVHYVEVFGRFAEMFFYGGYNLFGKTPFNFNDVHALLPAVPHLMDIYHPSAYGHTLIANWFLEPQNDACAQP